MGFRAYVPLTTVSVKPPTFWTLLRFGSSRLKLRLKTKE